MAIPSKLGGPDTEGLPVPQTPEGTPDPAYAETDPAADEVQQTAEATARGIDVAPPSKLGVGDRAKYGDNPAPRRSALPTGDDEIPSALLEAARKGNTAAASRVREMRAAALARAKDQRNFDADERVRKADIGYKEAQTKLSLSNLDEKNFEITQKKLKMFNDGITGKIQALDGLEDTVPVTRGDVDGKVKSLISDFEKFHEATPDGKSAKVTPEGNGYKVVEIDDETGEVVSEQSIGTIGDLRNFGRITGVIAQGENLGQYTAGVLADKANTAIAKSKAISEEAKLEASQSIEKFLDRKALANPETRKQLEAEALRLGAVIGDDAYDVVEKVETDPETGKQTKVRVRENKFIKMMQLSAPSTTIETPKGPATAEQFISQTVLKNPQAAIQEAGGIENLPMSIMEQMTKRGWPKETAEYYAQMATQQVQQKLAGALQQAARPAPASNAVPQRGTPGVNPRNPRQMAPGYTPDGAPVLNRAGIPFRQ